LIRHALTSTLLTDSCASCSLKTNSFQGPARTSCVALLPCPPLRGKLSPHTRDLSTAPSNVVYTKRTLSFRKFRSPMKRKRRRPPFFHAGRPTSHSKRRLKNSAYGRMSTEQSSAYWEDRRGVAFDRGWIVNDKRVERIWRRESLKVPAKQSKQGRIWLADGSCIRLLRRAAQPCLVL
jgi:hypothetical protein